MNIKFAKVMVIDTVDERLWTARVLRLRHGNFNEEVLSRAIRECMTSLGWSRRAG